MEFKNRIVELDENILNSIYGGKVFYKSNVKNVINYYLNLIPFVSRNHVRFKLDINEWTNEFKKGEDYLYQSRNIVETVELRKMKWSALSGLEKFEVLGAGLCTVILGGSFIGCTINRVIKMLNEPETQNLK